MSDELETDLFKFIPYEFDISLKDDTVETVNFSKRYRNQFTRTDLPAIVVSNVETGIVGYNYLNKLYSVTKNTTDLIEIESGVLEYDLQVNMATKITKVLGFVDISDDEETEEYEYKELDENSYFLDKDNNRIVFQTEDDLPKEDEYIKVYYTHEKIKAVLGGEFRDRIQIDVITTNYDKDDVFINGIVLCKKAVREIIKELKFGYENPDLNIREVTGPTNTTSIEGEDYHYRYSFDVLVAYHTTYTKIFDSIEKVNYELEAQVV